MQVSNVRIYKSQKYYLLKKEVKAWKILSKRD